MFSVSNKLNPDVVKTALDAVFYQEFNGTMNPGWITAESSSVFRQETMDNGAVIQEVFRGTGLWKTRAEEEDVPSAAPYVSNKIVYSPVNFAQSIDITKNFFDDNIKSPFWSLAQVA